jgi:hypothetical protein
LTKKKKKKKRTTCRPAQGDGTEKGVGKEKTWPRATREGVDKGVPGGV